MAKKRTGLQSKISAIFAGVPVPKKSQSRTKPKSSPEQDGVVDIEKLELEEKMSQTPVPEPAAPDKAVSQPKIPEEPVQEEVIPASEPPEGPDLEVVVPIPKYVEEQAPEEVPQDKAPEQAIPEIAVPQPEVSEPETVEPAVPKPKTVEEPEFRQLVEPLQEVLSTKVHEVKAPEPRERQIPSKISRRRKDKLFASKTGVGSGRQKTGIVLFIILSIALVLILARPYYLSRNNPSKPRTPGKTNVKVTPKADILIDWPVPTDYPIDLRDPMKLGTQRYVVPKTLSLTVKGISYSEDRKFAVIGTETVEEGDEILGATVIKINPSSVEFEKDGKRWTQFVEGNQ